MIYALYDAGEPSKFSRSIGLLINYANSLVDEEFIKWSTDESGEHICFVGAVDGFERAYEIMSITLIEDTNY